MTEGREQVSTTTNHQGLAGNRKLHSDISLDQGMSGNTGHGMQKDTEPLQSIDRIGTCKDYDKKLDNGLYIRGLVQNIPVNILVDSGCTSTIIS